MSPVEHVRLADGRQLDVRVSGPEDGFPLLYHHGTPGAATPIQALERAVHERGLRLVTTSRPGYGNSDRKAGRLVVDACADAAEVLAHLGIDRCVVAGWSGGGPHALACAARLDAAVGALAIASVAPFPAKGLDWLDGMGADNVAEFNATKGGEETLRSFLDLLAPMMRVMTAESVELALSTLLPKADRAVLSAELASDLAASFREGLRAGVDGWLDDDLAFFSPWGFGFDEISIPVAIWQGSEDLMVPFAHGKWLSDALPDASAHLVQGEGHLSIAIGAIDLMLDELLLISGLA